MSQISGTPLPLLIGKKLFYVGFVSMSEWETFGYLSRQIKEIDPSLYLIQCSLQRGNNDLSEKQINSLIRKYPLITVKIVELICKLSIPEVKINEDEFEKEEDRTIEQNMKMAYRLLAKMFGWTSATVSMMSPAQVFLHLTGGVDGTGIVRMSNVDYQRFRADRNQN